MFERISLPTVQPAIPDAPAPAQRLHPSYYYAPDQSVAVETPDVLIISDCVGAAVDWNLFVAGTMGQSLQHWLWHIIVDSEDAIPSEVNTFLQGDPRVRVIVAERSTRWLSRNRLAYESSSSFLCILAPQAIPAPTFLEKCCWVIGTNPGIAFCNSWSQDTTGNKWPYGFEQGARFLDENFAGDTFVIRREAFLASQGYDLAITDELAPWDFWLRQATQGQWGYTIGEYLLTYVHFDANAPFRQVSAEQLRHHVRQHYTAMRQHFPHVGMSEVQTYEMLFDDPPFSNPLRRDSTNKRILILMPWLIVGGAERVNLDITKYLRSIGYELSFATTYHAHQHGWLEEFSVYTSDIFILEHFLRLPDYPRFLVYLIKSRQIDTVMVSNSYLGYQLLPYLRAQCPEVTFVDYLHSQDEAWKNGGYPRCGTAYQELLDLNITTSVYVKDWMVKRGADPKRIEVAYTNVDIEKWRPNPEHRRHMRERLGINEQTAIILFIGRLSPEKRPKLLAQIIQRLNERERGNFRCFVLGAGPEANALQQQVRALRVSEVMQLLGRVDDSTLYDYMAAADILLLPSQVEGISVATFEAMAMGMVPVSAYVGGQPELVTSDVGALIHHNSNELDEYVEQLQRLVRNYELRRKMGTAARSRVENQFPLHALGPRMVELLELAVKYRQESPRPLVGLGLGREMATQAIEYTRVEQAIDALWVERESWRTNPRPHPTVATRPLTRQQRLRAFFKAKLYPLYAWGIDHGASWLVPLKDFLKARLK